MPIDYHAIPFGDRVLPCALAKHLARTGDARHFPDIEDGDCFGFVAMDGYEAVGHITLRLQRLDLPAMPDVNVFRDELSRLHRHFASIEFEAFVQTFTVEEPYRRRGIGRKLQQCAIDEAGRLGCLQMRSWSSADRDANYRLKLSMGFALVPGYSYIQRIDQWIPGVWFVLPLSSR